MWLVPAEDRIPTKKGYFPPNRQILPIECVVIHYTAGGFRPMRPQVARWAAFDPSVNDASTHLVTARDPKAERSVQLAPLNARTWHAGGSAFNGVKGVNRFSIGIDLDNLGFLRRVAGGFVDGYGRPYKGPIPFFDARGEPWEPYTEAAILEVCRFLKEIVERFPALQNAPNRIVGHEQIRKTKRDPGRAFDQFWPVLRAVTEGKLPKGLGET